MKNTFTTSAQKTMAFPSEETLTIRASFLRKRKKIMIKSLREKLK